MIRFTPYRSGSDANLNTVDDGQSTLMLDCGVRWTKLSQLLKGKATEVEGVLVTHSHGDHSRGVKDALHHGLDCWMSIETAKALSVEGIHRIEDGERHHIGTWTIDAFATVHDCPGSLGFVVTNQQGERLLYATDTQYLSPRWGDGCAILALEANYSLQKLRENVQNGNVERLQKHRVLWNHQSIDTVLKFLEKTDRSRLREVVLLHLSDANSDELDFKRRAAEIVGVPVRIA